MTDTGKSSPEKIAQFLLTFDGMAFLPLVTAAIVGARLIGSIRGRDRPISGHVIVAGLGNVGTRVLGQLHDLGVGVVCVDKTENAAGGSPRLTASQDASSGPATTSGPATGWSSWPPGRACPGCSRGAVRGSRRPADGLPQGETGSP